MKIENLDNVFVMKIEVLYDIEKQIEKAIPKMSKASMDEELKMAFVNHLEETKMQITRLESIFEMLGTNPKETKSEGIRGIIDDGEWVIDVNAPDTLKDAMIASAARHVEHFEMSAYMTTIKIAESLGLDNAIELLSKSLEEEENADKTLEMAIDKALQVA